MKNIIFLVFITLLILTNNAFAEGYCDSGDVFDQLACRAQNVGLGLRDVAYIIAGFGLITVAVMAIFGKMSWKNFSYIAISCFVLSIMAAIINYMGEGSKQAPGLKFDKSGEAAGDSGYNAKSVTIKK